MCIGNEEREQKGSGGGCDRGWKKETKRFSLLTLQVHIYTEHTHIHTQWSTEMEERCVRGREQQASKCVCVRAASAVIG